MRLIQKWCQNNFQWNPASFRQRVIIISLNLFSYIQLQLHVSNQFINDIQKRHTEKCTRKHLKDPQTMHIRRQCIHTQMQTSLDTWTKTLEDSQKLVLLKNDKLTQKKKTTCTMSLKFNLDCDYGFASEIVSVTTFLHH